MSRASGGIMSRPPRKQALALSPAAGNPGVRSLQQGVISYGHTRKITMS
jgi:hypothetical protein